MLDCQGLVLDAPRAPAQMPSGQSRKIYLFRARRRKNKEPYKMHTLSNLFNKISLDNGFEAFKSLAVTAVKVNKEQRSVKVTAKSDNAIENVRLAEYIERVRVAYNLLEFDIFVDAPRVEGSSNLHAHESGAVIFGKKVTGKTTEILTIEENTGRVAIMGEVVRVDARDGKGRQMTFIFDVYDGTSTIMCKIREFEDKIPKIIAKVKRGQIVKVKGDAYYDIYSRELCVKPSDIEIYPPPPEKVDTAETKRVELHAHTQMSAMDAMTDVKKLVERAAKFGHKAIAITDHGVVQAFPDAYNAARGKDIKVIFGLEAYLVNDKHSASNTLIKKINNDKEQSYVVFDIETTGFSPVNDKITEIGAVKIVNGEKIAEFSELINPQIPIPPNITELTGITDAMVKSADTIDKVLPRFIEFVGSSAVVAHNAGFDVSFIKHNAKEIGAKFAPEVFDTLALAREIFPDIHNHKLNTVAKHLGIKLLNHHRAVDDSAATAEIFLKCIEMIKDENFGKTKKQSYSSYQHAIILAKNQTGLKNLYKLVSDSHIRHFYKKPLILKSELIIHRDGLILGSACEAGELYQAILEDKPQETIVEIAKFYDYLELQPLANNEFLVRDGKVSGQEKLIEINRKIIEIGEQLQKPVVATCDVHFLDETDEVYRRVLFGGQGYRDADMQAPLHFRTTDEMLEEFAYLGEDVARKIVIENPNLIADMIGEISPVPKGLFAPKVPNAEKELVEICEQTAKQIYGDDLPKLIQTRMKTELDCIVKNNFAVMYMLAQKVVKKSNDDGYLVGSRGSVGSSFVAYLSGITEVNALAPHYICPSCKLSEFPNDESIRNGADMPNKDCPTCGMTMKKDGHNIPFETFLDLSGKKIPDIDLNFSGDYQSAAHKFIEELFGSEYVFRAGTIGTIAEKTAMGFARKYFETRNSTPHNAEVRRVAFGSVGTKRTTGQHPGGIIIVPDDKEVYDFCPIQHPADDRESGIITLHFDYGAVEDNLLKLDLLGHDDPTMLKMLHDLTDYDPREVPLDDEATLSLFSGTTALGIKPSDINSDVGTFGVPEFGTRFVRQMLVDTKPTTFSELVLISGLSHGTDVWLNNAQELIRNKIATLSEVICVRDDIMLYLNLCGVDSDISFSIMESVRKGKGLMPDWEQSMKDANVPAWYIESCKKIKYMFPKAHAAAYVTMAFRVAYYKINYPLEYYLTYFTVRADDFDAEIMTNGVARVTQSMKEIQTKISNKESTDKDEKVYTILELCLEMYKRGLEFLPVDIYKSHPTEFLEVDEKILPPLNSFAGLGTNAALSLAKAREDGPFLSQEELQSRAKLNKTIMEMLVKCGCLSDLPESSQIGFFDM